jgi:hypothetical protein
MSKSKEDLIEVLNQLDEIQPLFIAAMYRELKNGKDLWYLKEKYDLTLDEVDQVLLLHELYGRIK